MLKSILLHSECSLLVRLIWQLLVRSNSKAVQLSVSLFQQNCTLLVCCSDLLPSIAFIMIPKTLLSVTDKLAFPLIYFNCKFSFSSSNSQLKDHRSICKIRIIPSLHIHTYLHWTELPFFFTYPELPCSVCKLWHLIIHSSSKWFMNILRAQTSVQILMGFHWWPPFTMKMGHLFLSLSLYILTSFYTCKNLPLHHVSSNSLKSLCWKI